VSAALREAGVAAGQPCRGTHLGAHEIARAAASGVRNIETVTEAYDDQGEAENYAPLALDELTKSVRLLREELEGALSQDDWVLVPQWSILSSAYAGAALSHCAVLLAGMDDARLSGQALGGSAPGAEMMTRLGIRSLIESWLVGLFLVYGGDEALDWLAASYQAAIEKTVRAIHAYNDTVKAAAGKARKRNRKLGALNDKRVLRNEIHPQEPPLSLYKEVTVPWRQPMDVDLSAALAGAQSDVPPEETPLSALADRVDQLADERGDRVTARAIYEAAYRVTSTFAAHTTLGLLDSYLSHNVGWFVRLTTKPSTPSTAESTTRSGLVLTAMLARRTLAMRGSPSPIASAIEALATRHEPHGPSEANSGG
jgi:hypothetical protein